MASGRSAHEQLSTGVGEQEEALRTPLVNLVREVGSRHGLQVVPVGEAMLSDLQVRPDYSAGQRSDLRIHRNQEAWTRR